MTINAEFLNTDQRCACALVLDTSGSMQGEPIDHLNQGLGAFERQLKADRLASRRIELALITFGNDGVRLCQPFVQARHFNAPVLAADGVTPMGEAVSAAVELLRHRKNEYRTNGVQYYRPWLMLVTDGEPTDEGWQQAAAEVRQEELQRGLTCFPIGVGRQVNFEVLGKFSSKPPAHLNGFDFEQMFVWLSGSLGRISASRPGDQVELAGVDTWGSVRG